MKQKRFDVECFSSIDDPRLREDWHRLAQTGTGTAFQSLDYVSAVQHAFLENAPEQPRYVVLRDRDDGRAVLIMPMIERKRLAVRILETMDFDVIDYAAPLYCPEVFSRRDAAGQAAGAFLDFASGYDVLCSRNWSAEPEGLECMLPLFGTAQLSTEVTYSVPLAGGRFETYRKRNSAFKQAMKKLRRMEKEFGATVCCLTHRDDIDTAFDAMLEQRRIRFRAIGKSDGMADPRRQRLFRSIAHKRCPGQEALFIGICIDGSWIATSFAMIHNGVINAQLSSFAEGPWSRHSPGLVTMALELDWAHRHGLRTYVLGPGDAGYKQRFGVDVLRRMALTKPMTPVGALYVAGHQAKHALKRLIKQSLGTLPGYRMPIAHGSPSFKRDLQAFPLPSIGPERRPARAEDVPTAEAPDLPAVRTTHEQGGARTVQPRTMRANTA